MSALENNQAILLCRVSSEKQAEGYSLDFQEKGGIKHAESKGLVITKTWKLTESASSEDRKKWEEFLDYVRKGPEKHILIPKVDRCLRNLDDLALVAKIPKLYHKVLHFFHDGLTFQEDSPAADVLRLGVQGVVAAWYSVDLAQKTKRGMDEKASQGEWPERAPYGYKNDVATKLIVVDPERAPWVKRIKELSAVGLHSIERIRELLIADGYPMQRHRLHINLIERIIRSPLYAGFYYWPKTSATLIKGKHTPIVSWELHQAAVKGLERYGKPKGRKRDFAFAGLVRCGHCPEHRAVTFEIHKGSLCYGHCTGLRRTKVRQPSCTESEYVRLEVFEEQFLEALKGAQLPPDEADLILAEISSDAGEEATAKLTQVTLVKQELSRLENRMKQAYTDRLDGKISEELWAAKHKEWESEKLRLEEQVKRLDESAPASYLPTGKRVLELSKRLDSLYFSGTPSDKRELLDVVCSNFFLHGKKLDYTYRKPFDLWAEGLHSGRWLPD